MKNKNFLFSILSVNYSAKALGIKRSLDIDVAQSLCPNLVILQTGLRCNRTDAWTPQQLESDRILAGIKAYKKDLPKQSICVERAHPDEFFLDVTNLVNSRSKASFIPRKADVEKLSGATKEDPCHKYFGQAKVVVETCYGQYSSAELKRVILQVCE